MSIRSVRTNSPWPRFQSHQTQQPEDHIEDLGFWEQVLSKLDARQGLQEGYRSERREKK